MFITCLIDPDFRISNHALSTNYMSLVYPIIFHIKCPSIAKKYGINKLLNEDFIVGYAILTSAYV